MGLIHRKYTFPAGCSCHQAVIRETDGHDEKDAAKWADVRGTTITAELIRLAVVTVRWTDDDADDLVATEQPFMALDEWTTRTRELVMEAYQSINESPEAEKAVFHAASVDVAPLVKRATPRGRSSTPTTDE